MATPPSSPRLLLVDTNEDHRKSLLEGLRGHGYVVDEAASAPEAQARLAERAYGLVIAHYTLTGSTAVELLRQAREAGFMSKTASIVFTGRADLEGTADFRVMRKPIDISALLAQVESILGPAPPAAGIEPSATGRPAAKVELVLYVTAPSPSSHRAVQNLQKLLASVPPTEVSLTVRDLADEPEQAERDRVVFSPTLVKVRPEPRAWILGDLSDRDTVVDLLLACGLEIFAPPTDRRSSR